MLMPLTLVRPWLPFRTRCMLKNEPLKSNENGIVGKPAVPTVAPGGSALVSVLAGVVVLGVLPVAEATAAAAPAGAAAAGLPVPVSLMARKSTWLALAVVSSW